MIKYREEIKARPRAEWTTNRREKLETKRESYKDLKNIKDKFNGGPSAMPSKNNKQRAKKRDEKATEKAKAIASVKGGTKFAGDFESDFQKKQKQKKEGAKGAKDDKPRKPKRPESAITVAQGDNAFKPGQKYNQTDKSFKGKRNTVGAKIAGYRGSKSLKKFKKS
jgi:hypothetical protein